MPASSPAFRMLDPAIVIHAHLGFLAWFFGKEAEMRLGEVDITVNKNMVPFDERSPMVTSGIRIGTPAVSTRGLAPAEMAQIAEFIDLALSDRYDDLVRQELRARVRALCDRFPLYS